MGVILSIALVYLITDMFNTYMNIYNFATFFMIFIIGVIVLTGTFIIVQKIKKRTINKGVIAKTIFISLVIMDIVLIVFGFAFYDYSTPRDVPFGKTYQNVYSMPSQLNDGWKVSSLIQEEMDTLVYNTVVNKLVNDRSYKRMHSILIIKNGKLVAEDYFYNYDKNTPHDLRSANKTITSILIGIAIDKGFIKDVNEKIYDMFPEYQSLIDWGKNKKIVSIKHLLTMNTGLDCNDWDSSSVGNENKLYKTNDWIKAFLELPYKEKSGSQFSYCTFGEMMLRAIIVKATGTSLQDFAKEYLFTPLNITNYKWTTVMPNREDIGIRVSLTSRDFAKLGQLYLDNGIWNKNQIVSKKWIEASVSNHTTTTEKRLGYPKYGFLWWKNYFDIKGKHVNGYQAQGNGGQLVFVFPDFDMIVVFTAGNYGNPRMINGFNILKEEILPSIINNNNIN
ncbi:serine hydrolase [Aquimarina sp. Aq78]|uniref:serine hydrolase domain-containing protein n=1 Tax=Aquimarina sp. Aq78 TaxID=1191889 RepID=UPI00131CB8F9|nr:serine hydrolase [Aquimarina sp. Aq78]